MSELPATGVWHDPAAPADRPDVPGYELHDELGRGGMGVVYRATHFESGNTVALKVIRDAVLAGPADRARFRAEADAAMRMDHPNLVRILDLGEHAGHPYLAMEYVAGGNLDGVIDGRVHDARDCAAFVRTLAEGVAHAHERNVVHRDLKPANVLLADFAGSLATCRPVVADFGLARRLDADTTRVTHDGAVLGTPGYMAPEQAAGRTDDIGPATDVHALGVIFYELLAGTPPFDGDTRERLLKVVIHDDPTPPSRHRPDLPKDLDTVCLKCLEKDPAKRYATARELADELGRYLSGHPLTTEPIGKAELTRRAAVRDGYAFVGEVGRGPRSVVYQVRHESSARPLALKVFARGHATKDEWEHTLETCRTHAVALTHPNVVPVLRGGEWDGVPFVVTEFAPLGSLAGLFAGTPMKPARAVRIVERVAEIVQYLHRQGVVHGNLKLTNILLAADDTPRLIDWRPTGAFHSGPLPESDPRALASLPPEYLADPAAPLHPPADVYGLGLILYELLTGHSPFAASAAPEAIDAVLHRDALPLTDLLGDVHPLLDYVVRRSLLKNPWMRFSRVYDFGVRLGRVRKEIE
jgi:serine/threonine protein kinase